tara:strand:- start:6284 stop:7285 length:1002 start_codon:yes stop_codon:yes gene_type:complete
MQVIRILGFPISLIYALVVHIRNYLFDIGFLKSMEFKTPTICVGNLSVGGTGKTPMIEYLINLLKEDYRIAVLSRGYGRKSRGFHLSDSSSTVENLGDEPFQIHSKFPEIQIAVDADRQNALSILEKDNKLDVVLLDDAFQHRKVKPTSSILLTSFDNLYIEDWYLPTGSLRDSKREAKRASLIIVTKCPENLSDVMQSEIISKIKPNTNQDVLFSFLKYDYHLRGENESITIEDIKNKKVTLVTGIANPKPLLEFLDKNEIKFDHLAYRDHHFFSNNEIENFRSKEFILTTEKDYVRLKGKVDNLWYIAIEHKFFNNGDKILRKKINQIAKK